MKIAIYARTFDEKSSGYISSLFEVLDQKNILYYLFHDFEKFIKPLMIPVNPAGWFENALQITTLMPDCMISLGGDGTLLDTVALVKDSGIPVLGINLGRLGFLASINKNEIVKTIEELLEKNFSVDSRSMISLLSDPPLFGSVNYALNECTIHKRDSSPMIIVHAFLNDQFLNSYWADGIIISTPTGSTAYSLSCGGPILFPNCHNLVLTPIGPHNLSMRPVVINDDQILSFEIEGRSSEFLVSLDSRTEIAPANTKIKIQKEKFQMNLIRMRGENFLTTLRGKMMWGMDTRN
jgi:NAD+ kinase